MVQRLVNKIVEWQVGRNAIDGADAAIYRYGYTSLCGVAVNLALAVIIGIASRTMAHVAMFLLLYIPLRSFCGGWHAPKLWQCTLISSLLTLAEAILIKTAASRVPAAFCIAAFAAGIAIVLALSPVETATRKIEAYEHGLYKKKTAIIALCHAGIMAASVAYGARRCAFVVMYVYVVQSVMLLCGKACRIKN